MPRRQIVRYAWLNIKDDIQDQIYQGKYGPGDRIDTVAQLAEKHGVSTTTVRQALDELAAEGILEVRQGRGSIVAHPKHDYDPTLSFEEQCEQLGGLPRTEIFRMQWIEPHADTTLALNLKKGQQIWEITRIHYRDSEAVGFDVTRFPRKLAERIVGNSDVLQSLYLHLPQMLGYERLDSNVGAVRVSSERAFSDLLGIARRTFFFHIKKTVYGREEALCDSVFVLRSDRFQLRFGAHQARPPAATALPVRKPTYTSLNV